MRTIPWECELLTVHFSIVLGIGKARAARNLHYRTRNLYFSEILLKCVVPGSCNPAGCVYHSYGLAPPTTVIQKLSNPPSPWSLVFSAAASRGFLLTSSNLPFHLLSHILSQLEQGVLQFLKIIKHFPVHLFSSTLLLRKVSTRLQSMDFPCVIYHFPHVWLLS